MEPIRSLQNRSVVEAGRLHRVQDRRRSGATLVEGPNALREALDAGVEVRQVFALPDDPEQTRWPHLRLVDEAVMAKLAGTATPRGPVAVVTIPASRFPPPDRPVIVMWGLGDPGNVGTIVRTAAAFGYGVAVGPDTADPWAPKVLRAGAGGHFRTELFPVRDVGALGERPLAALVVDGGVEPAALPTGPWALVVGSEAHGLPEETVAACDARVTIPMVSSLESLNAAVAVSVAAYALRRRNRSGAGGPPH